MLEFDHALQSRINDWMVRRILKAELLNVNRARYYYLWVGFS